MKKWSLMLLASAAISGSAKDFVGLRTTLDDETKSVFRIYRHQDRYFGRIVNLFTN